MTPAQLATFKAAILADPNLVEELAAGDHGAIAFYYNEDGAGNIWRPAITTSELNTAIVWSEFIALNQGQRDAYRALIAGTVDATDSGIRLGFGFIFTGQTLMNVSELAQRPPTRFEQLFTTAAVSTVFGHIVTVDDVATALGS